MNLKRGHVNALKKPFWGKNPNVLRRSPLLPFPTSEGRSPLWDFRGYIV